MPLHLLISIRVMGIGTPGNMHIVLLGRGRVYFQST